MKKSKKSKKEKAVGTLLAGGQLEAGLGGPSGEAEVLVGRAGGQEEEPGSPHTGLHRNTSDDLAVRRNKGRNKGDKGESEGRSKGREKREFLPPYGGGWW
jgi:hypothetical protein